MMGQQRGLHLAQVSQVKHEALAHGSGIAVAMQNLNLDQWPLRGGQYLCHASAPSRRLLQ